MVRLLDLIVIWIAKLAVRLARCAGRGGSALPGLIAERTRPGLLARFASRLPDGVVVVTGTNGKTTTSKMITTVLEADGRRVFANRSGSNMVRGLLSAAIDQCDALGRLPADAAVLEVDEPHVEGVAAAVGPDVLLVLNLHRDQLDRYGELERTAELIGAGLPHAGRVVLNADDPLVAALGAETTTPTSWFGVGPELRDLLPDDASLLGGPPRADTTTPEAELRLESTNETGTRQEMVVTSPDGPLSLDLPLTGVYNAVNATAATLVLRRLAVDEPVIRRGLQDLVPAFGRGETVHLDGAALRLQLVKNPSSFSQLIWTQLGHGPPRRLLFALNDLDADGRDVSWIWDVDLEALAGRSDRILVTGIRATDLAVRLKYAELDCEVVEDLDDAVERLVGLDPDPAEDDVAVVVPTYTAMLALRDRLGRRTELAGIWT